jgi:hypothetical protein
MGDPKRDFKRGRVLVAFNSKDSLARDEDEIGKLLLCHRARGAKLSYGVAKAGAHAAILYATSSRMMRTEPARTSRWKRMPIRKLAERMLP